MADNQLAHQALDGLPKNFIQREVAYSFITGVKDIDMKQHLLMGGEKSPNEDFSQALKLEAVKVAAGLLARIQEVWAAAPMGTQLPGIKHHRTGKLVCCLCRGISILRRDC